MKMQKNNNILGKWVDEKVAVTWPPGIVVLIHRLDRPDNHYRALELDTWFRPDWVKNKAVGYDTPMEFMRITIDPISYD